jgi:HrpA-like RNA helicase
MMNSSSQQQLQISAPNHLLNFDQHLETVDFLNPLTGASFSSNYWTLLEERKKLTIWQHKQQFMDMLDQPNTQFILLEAETGSGKTTQIPQWFFSGNKLVYYGHFYLYFNKIIIKNMQIID